MDMNRCIFAGRITKDVELRYSQNGKANCSFQIANNKGKDKDPNWISIKLWNNADKIYTYLKKGTQVIVDCRLEQFKNQKGDTVSEYVADRIQLISGLNNNNNNNNQQPKQAEFDEDVPF